jgi:hypothetical protein
MRFSGQLFFVLVQPAMCGAMLQYVPNQQNRLLYDQAVVDAFESIKTCGHEMFLAKLDMLKEGPYKNVFIDKWMWLRSGQLVYDPAFYIDAGVEYTFRSFLQNMFTLLEQRQHGNFSVPVGSLGSMEPGHLLALLYEIVQEKNVGLDIQFFTCFDVTSGKLLYFEPMDGSLAGYKDPQRGGQVYYFNLYDLNFGLGRCCKLRHDYSQRRVDPANVGIDLNNIQIMSLGFVL